MNHLESKAARLKLKWNKQENLASSGACSITRQSAKNRTYQRQSESFVHFDGVARLSKARVVRRFYNGRNSTSCYIHWLGPTLSQRDLCPQDILVGLQACYNMDFITMMLASVRSDKGLFSVNRGLQFDLVKQELLVIVDHNATVNNFAKELCIHRLSHFGNYFV